jgi:hypothetical protein
MMRTEQDKRGTGNLPRRLSALTFTKAGSLNGCSRQRVNDTFTVKRSTCDYI